MKTKWVRSGISILVLGLWAAGCAGSRDSSIEEAQFLLDHSKFTEAAALVQPIVTANPQDEQATFVLASALLGKAVLGNNRTYLGLLGDLLETPASGETEFQTFARIAPDSSDQLSDLETATNLLKNLTTFVKTLSSEDVYLQLYISRLFEIAGVVTQVGVCATGGYDPTAFIADTGETARFQDNLANVNGDGKKAGLPTDFPLVSRISSISETINSQGIADFLNSEFGAAGISEQICVLR